MRRLLIALALLAPASAVAGEDGCRLLLRHLAAADAAYRPGIDVRGRAVAPADLAPPPAALRQGIVLVDLSLPAGLFRPGPPRRFDLAELVLGLVEIELASGAVSLDGQPLAEPEADRLVAWCRGGMRRPPLPAHKPMP